MRRPWARDGAAKGVSWASEETSTIGRACSTGGKSLKGERGHGKMVDGLQKQRERWREDGLQKRGRGGLVVARPGNRNEARGHVKGAKPIWWKTSEVMPRPEAKRWPPGNGGVFWARRCARAGPGLRNRTDLRGRISGARQIGENRHGDLQGCQVS